jgi:hypothetical protein
MSKKILFLAIYYALFLLIIFLFSLTWEFTWRESWLEYSLFFFIFGLLGLFRINRGKVLDKLAEKKSSKKTRLILAFSLLASIILFIFVEIKSS